MSERQLDGTHCVVAGLLIEAGMVLLCHRSPGRRWYPNVWDLPGGHREPDETPTAGLVRELHEELGIHIAEPLQPAFAHIRRSDVDCRIWVIRSWVGTVRNASGEHDQIAWWDPVGMDDLALADESYRPLFKKAVSDTPI
jgi:8-oxo-dGTP diphosphatase